MQQLDAREVAVLRAIRRAGRPLTRAEVGEAVGLARSVISPLCDDMLGRGLLVNAVPAPSTGGRPAQRLAIGRGAARVVVVDIGGSRSRVGLTDLGGSVLAEARLDEPVESGPDAIMSWAAKQIDSMLAEHGRTEHLGIVVGLPGPVDFATGSVVSPPIMVGWEGFSSAAYLSERFDAPVVIDNDVNLIALAEHRLSFPDSQVLLVIKLGTGIGGGIVVGGNVLRGARGGAGDIGHTQASPSLTALCRCGHVGCVEAQASGWAMSQQLRDMGYSISSVTDIATLAREGNAEVSAILRGALSLIGTSIANAVSLLNPDTVVLAGELLGAGEQVLAIIRESVYQESSPLATNDLVITTSKLGPLVGLHGGAELGYDLFLGEIDSPQIAAFA